jgi:hypothetical protein
VLATPSEGGHAIRPIQRSSNDCACADPNHSVREIAKIEEKISGLLQLPMRERRLYRDPVKLAFLVLVTLRNFIHNDISVVLTFSAGEKHFHNPIVWADALATVFAPRHVSGAQSCR